MSEHWNCEHLSSDHLWAIAEHAQSQIELWTGRAERAIAQLAIREEVILEYPTEN